MATSIRENPGHAGALLIGEWLLRPDLNQIERDATLVHLEPKAVAILCLLAERAGEAVPRQELLDRAWAGVVVSDDALTQAVIKLRKALGDSSRNPQYIETIPKRGYRLVAPVEPEMSAAGATGKRNRMVPVLVAGLLLAGAAYLLSDRTAEKNSTLVAPAVDREVAEGASVAVLAFEALGQDERGRNFALGITADLSTDLSKLSGLWVINTRQGDAAAQQARYLVGGSVQYVPDRINVHVRLLESESGHQLWSERYDRPLVDLFDVQRAISEEIVRRLQIEVSAADRQRLAKRYTLSIPAYEDFLRGQSELLLRERSANQNARNWYYRAIEKDPAFARAYAGLALSYAADFRNQWIGDRESALIRAADTADTAQQIDPSIPEVYWVLGYVDTQMKKPDSALTHLQKALDLDQSYADAHALMGGIDTYRGQPELSIPRLRQAMRLNPGAGYLYYLLLGRAYFFIGNVEQAQINLHESLSRNPDNLEARIYLAAATAVSGDPDAAQWEIDEIRVMDPEFELRTWLETYPMVDQKQIGRLSNALAKAGL